MDDDVDSFRRPRVHAFRAVVALLLCFSLSLTVCWLAEMEREFNARQAEHKRLLEERNAVLERHIKFLEGQRAEIVEMRRAVRGREF